MSAFIVNKAHINAMVTLAMNERLSWYTGECRHEITSNNVNQVGQMLLDENVHAVSCRYPNDKITDLPGMDNSEWLIPFEWAVFCRMPSPVEAIKLLHCYHYQCIEDPNFEQTQAYAFYNSLLANMTTKLPEYEEAPWEWEDPRYYETHNINV